MGSANVTAFQERVYALLKQIPAGRVTTYAAMARVLGSSPRAVGGALRVNPFAPEVPCHRCIASTGVSLPPSPRICSGADSGSMLAGSRATGRMRRAASISSRS